MLMMMVVVMVTFIDSYVLIIYAFCKLRKSNSIKATPLRDSIIISNFQIIAIVNEFAQSN